MAGKGRLYRFFILVITVFTVVGCSSPMGSIGGHRNASDAPDGIVAVPSKTTYYLNGQFRPQTDLQVYTTYHGQRQYPAVSIGDCVIQVEDPRDSGIFFPVAPNGNYPFTSPGWKTIVVSYQNFPSAQYYVEVLPEPDPDPDPDPDSGLIEGINIGPIID